MVRLILGLLGAIQATDGLYALFAPRSFYDDFPLGRGWVEALPAYNEHLVRDVGGLFIATAVILLAAASGSTAGWSWSRRVSFLAFAVPHATWHMFNLGPYGTVRHDRERRSRSCSWSSARWWSWPGCGPARRGRR